MNQREPKYNSILELLFSNRNKQYGAYDLRKQYVKHLRIAFFATLIAFLLFISIPYLLNWWETNDWFQPTNEMTLIPIKNNQLKLETPPPVEKTPPPKQEPKPPKPKPPKPKTTPSPKPDLAPIVTPQNPIKQPNNPTTTAPQTDNTTQQPDSNQTVGKSDSVGTKKNPFKESDSAAEPLDTLPMFPGGMTAFHKYIYSNLRYPPKVLRDSIQGTIVATFIVNVDGSISDVKIPNEFKMNNDCDDEVLRVLRLMPFWKPGRRNGQNVKAMCVTKVSFSTE